MFDLYKTISHKSIHISHNSMNEPKTDVVNFTSSKTVAYYNLHQEVNSLEIFKFSS